MIFEIDFSNIPGTNIRIGSEKFSSGEDLIRSVAEDGSIKFAAIHEITGIESSTLQNWTKRGWVDLVRVKKYSPDLFARILILNMLRDSMRLDKIVFLISYINGRVYDSTDRIVSDSELYIYLSNIIQRLNGQTHAVTPLSVRAEIEEETGLFSETIPGTHMRLKRVLEAMIFAYFSSLAVKESDTLTEEIIRS